jgi:hypothetical protein
VRRELLRIDAAAAFGSAGILLVGTFSLRTKSVKFSR